MTEISIVDLKSLVSDGTLYRSLDPDQRIEALIPTTGHSNHSSQLLFLNSGDLFCCWMAGSYEGDAGMNIVGSILAAGSAQWSPCIPVATDKTHSLQNPVPYQDPSGRLYVLYTSQETRNCSEEEWRDKLASGEVTGSFTMQHTAQVLYTVSDNGGRSWESGKILFSTPGSFIRQRTVTLLDGRIMLPMYYSGDTNDVSSRYGNDYSVIRTSRSITGQWDETKIPSSRGRVHMSVVKTSDPDKFIAFFRSRSADRIYRSVSRDNGTSWSAPERTILPNNNASIMAISLKSGRIAMIFNYFSAQDGDSSITLWPKQRYRLTLALSEDGGVSWPYMRILEMGDGFFDSSADFKNREISYPTIIEGPDGSIHCSYTFSGRDYIKYATVDEHWIMG